MSRFSTPLRYPGGKQKIAPFIFELLYYNKLIGGHYAEPYAGGAGVAMQLLLDGSVNYVHLNDSSYPIYAFWNSIISQPDEFCRRIRRASLDVNEWKKQKEVIQNPMQYEEIDVGFSTFYLNRCNRSGILTGGIIGGISQKGEWKIDARFPRNELIRRIEVIADKKNSISLRNWDAEKFICEYIPNLPANTFVYCDPPYFEKSSKLYLDKYTKYDHERISVIIQTKLKRKWAVSYDNAEEILNYYSKRRHFIYDLQYSASTSYKGSEVFMFSDDAKVPINSSLFFIDRSLQVAKRQWKRHDRAHRFAKCS